MQIRLGRRAAREPSELSSSLSREACLAPSLRPPGLVPTRFRLETLIYFFLFLCVSPCFSLLQPSFTFDIRLSWCRVEPRCVSTTAAKMRFNFGTCSSGHRPLPQYKTCLNDLPSTRRSKAGRLAKCIVGGTALLAAAGLAAHYLVVSCLGLGHATMTSFLFNKAH